MHDGEMSGVHLSPADLTLYIKSIIRASHGEDIDENLR